jgi:hypothetical protein
MKGTIITCLRELVVARKGPGAWREVLGRANVDSATIFMLSQDVDEGEAVAMFNSAAKVLGLDWQGLCDAFGHHWCVVYAPNIYKSFYMKHKNVKAFMLDINAMHERMTAAMPSARPPRFRAVAEGNSLLISYESPRGLIDLAIGLTRGMGDYFNEKISVTRLSPSQFRVDF